MTSINDGDSCVAVDCRHENRLEHSTRQLECITSDCDSAAVRSSRTWRDRNPSEFGCDRFEHLCDRFLVLARTGNTRVSVALRYARTDGVFDQWIGCVDWDNSVDTITAFALSWTSEVVRGTTEQAISDPAQLCASETRGHRYLRYGDR